MKRRRLDTLRLNARGVKAGLDAFLQLARRSSIKGKQQDSVGRHKAPVDRVSRLATMTDVLPEPAAART